MTHPSIDGVLIQWGDRLFYPANRLIKSHTPCLHPPVGRAAEIRNRIEATVRRAPQVMVKVTGGGRGMTAIAAHLRYISTGGRLDIEDDRGAIERGKESLHEIEHRWRIGGAQIDVVSPRREAFNVMLSMLRGTDPLTVQWAAREFARVEFAAQEISMRLVATSSWVPKRAASAMDRVKGAQLSGSSWPSGADRFSPTNGWSPQSCRPSDPHGRAVRPR
jgi:hypothetical protein